MLQAVFDTNIIVSAAIKKEGIPALLLALFFEDKITLFTSSILLTEYEQVLKRPKFGFGHQEVDNLINQIKEKAIIIEPIQEITQIKDIPDNRVLECASCAKVSYIVTGNKHHFTFKQFKGTKIVNPREFFIAFLAEGRTTGTRPRKQN